jgi:hypothetical protein
MSLGKFLAAGRSLMGMRETSSRYSVRTIRPLPKFGSEKNPFAKATTSESPKAAPAPKPAFPPRGAKPYKPAILPKSEAVGPKELPATTSLFESRAAAPEPQPAAPAAAKVAKSIENVRPKPVRVDAPISNSVPTPGTRRAPLAEWAKKFNPLQYIPTWTPGAVRTRPVRAAVQTELSLERVRVVRNDLSEADLEVVPARRTPAARSAQTFEASEPQPSAPVSQLGALNAEPATGWGRFTSRLFGAGQTTTTH